MAIQEEILTLRKGMVNWKVCLTLLLGVACFTVEPQNASANNIAVATNVTLTDLNTVNSNVMVNFDVGWDNSWRASWVESGTWTNWDAAWVFVKYREQGSNDWHHATQKATPHFTA